MHRTFASKWKHLSAVDFLFFAIKCEIYMKKMLREQPCFLPFTMIIGGGGRGERRVALSTHRWRSRRLSKLSLCNTSLCTGQFLKKETCRG